jgi:hypothetical protein
MMVKFITRYRGLTVTLGLVGLALVIWLGVMREFRLDDSFITYRYAQNLAAGNGLVYNPGETTLSTTAPLYAMLLALLSLFVPDFHLLGGLLGTLAIGVGGGVICRLTKSVQGEVGTDGQWQALWAGIAYTLAAPLWLALGMETPIWMMLVLVGFAAAFDGRWRLGGLSLGLAVVMRMDSALPAVLLGLLLLAQTINQYSTRKSPFQALIQFLPAFALPVLIYIGWSYLTYGSPFPVTLGAKSAQAFMGITGFGPYVTMFEGLALIAQGLFAQSSLYIVFLLMPIFGLAGRLPRVTVLLAAWGLLHLLAYAALGVAPYRWYYAPVIPGVIALATTGLCYLQNRLKDRGVRAGGWLIVAIAGFGLVAQVISLATIYGVMQRGDRSGPMLPIVDWQVYQETGEWLAANTPTDALVGVAEVGQIGFYARRTMTDYLGLLQPDVTANLHRGDLYSWLVGYAPDYLVFQRFRGSGLALYNLFIQDDKWFNANYRQVAQLDDPRYQLGPVQIYQRMLPVSSVTLQPVVRDFGGLRLTGVALDTRRVPISGGAVRVRLDWQVIGPLPNHLYVAVKLLNRPLLPGHDGHYDTTHWSGSFSTWHGLVIPAGLGAGHYRLLVAVGEDGSNTFIEQNVSALELYVPR